MSQSTDTPKGPASQRGERAKERVTRELGFEVNPGKKSLTWTGNEESTFGWKVDIADDSDIRLWFRPPLRREAGRDGGIARTGKPLQRHRDGISS